MTGRYQQRFGHENNPVLDLKDTTLGLPPSSHHGADASGGDYQTIASASGSGGAPPFIRTRAALRFLSDSLLATMCIFHPN